VLLDRRTTMHRHVIAALAAAAMLPFATLDAGNGDPV
jgi:hypothetical protein